MTSSESETVTHGNYPAVLHSQEPVLRFQGRVLSIREPVSRFQEPVSSSLAVSVPTEIAAACYSGVDALARSLLRDGDDGRTLDQLRADVTADLLLGRGPGTAAPEATAMLSVHGPVDAALSISDEECELDGCGPIPAPIAREIMTNERSI